MRFRRVAWGAALLLMACSGSEKSANVASNAAANAEVNSDAQNRVRDRPEGQRNGVLIRAIRDANLECQNVETSELTQTSNNLPVYMATCERGAVFAIAIRDDGTATVRQVMPAEGQK